MSSRVTRRHRFRSLWRLIRPRPVPECGYGEVVVSAHQGRGTVEYLVNSGRLEPVADVGTDDAADHMLSRARLRLTTAVAGLDGGDVDGAFVAAYDAYRMAAESLLARQGLRATGGEGSHMTVEDAVWAIATARSAAEGTRRISEGGNLSRFDSS